MLRVSERTLHARGRVLLPWLFIALWGAGFASGLTYVGLNSGWYEYRVELAPDAQRQAWGQRREHI